MGEQVTMLETLFITDDVECLTSSHMEMYYLHVNYKTTLRNELAFSSIRFALLY